MKRGKNEARDLREAPVDDKKGGRRTIRARSNGATPSSKKEMGVPLLASEGSWRSLAGLPSLSGN